MKRAVAVAAFNGSHKQLLSVQEGDSITILRDQDVPAGYLECRNDKGITGLVPANHLVILDVSPQEEASGKLADVIHTFKEPPNGAYMAVRKGDTVILLGPSRHEGWLECSSKGMRGLVPEKFIRVRAPVVVAATPPQFAKAPSSLSLKLPTVTTTTTTTTTTAPSAAAAATTTSDAAATATTNDTNELVSPRAAPSPPHRYAALVELLFQDHLSLLGAIGKTVKPTSLDKLGKALLRLFQDNGLEIFLMRAGIEGEVALAAESSDAVLFRRNSIYSTILGAYARSVGSDFVIRVLFPIMGRIVTGTEHYEVDPDKLAEKDRSQLEQNHANCQARVDELIDALVQNAHLLPVGLVNVCAMLRNTVREKLPAAKPGVAVGGFLMLRFVCPFFVAPEQYGLPTPPPERRRGLTLLSKLLQNLSNDVEMGKKEPFMQPFDARLSGSRARLRSFLEGLGSNNQSAASTPRSFQNMQPPSGWKIDADSANEVYSFLRKEDTEAKVATLLQPTGEDQMFHEVMSALALVTEPLPKNGGGSGSGSHVSKNNNNHNNNNNTRSNSFPGAGVDTLLADLEAVVPSLRLAPPELRDALGQSLLQIKKASDKVTALRALVPVLKKDRKQRTELDRVKEELVTAEADLSALEKSRDELISKCGTALASGQ